METKKSPLSIRLIYWITNVTFWLLMFYSFLLIVGTILLYTGVNKGNSFVGGTVPVLISVSKPSHLLMNKQDIKLKLTGSTYSINFINPPDFIAKKIAPFMLLYFLILTYLAWIFRRFIKNVKKGETFTVKNISLLKRISYVLAGYWLVAFVSSLLASYYITGHIEIQNSFLFNEHMLWEALFIWVLAHIFITGLKLKQEKDLTI